MASPGRPVVPSLRIPAVEVSEGRAQGTPQDAIYTEDFDEDESVEEDLEEEDEQAASFADGKQEQASLTSGGLSPLHRPASPEPEEPHNGGYGARPRAGMVQPPPARDAGTPPVPRGEAPDWAQGRRAGSAPAIRNEEPQDVESDGEDGAVPAQEEADAASYPSYSWRETLQRFPALIRLYPLAVASEVEVDEEQAENGVSSPNEHGPSPVNAGHLEGNEAEDFLNGCVLSSSSPSRHPGRALSQTLSVASSTSRPVTARQPPERNRPGTAAPAGRTAREAQERFSSTDLASAWAEVKQARRDLGRRERELEMRELAVRRAEARNKAMSKQLSELRQHLEMYEEEIEEGVLMLSAQQDAVREERRQLAELHARARRACATAVREDVVAKVKSFERRSVP